MGDSRRCLRSLLVPGLAALLGACVPQASVERAYDGNVVSGRAVDARAYAAFLRATLAEANGDVATALAGYAEAVALDPAAAEAWSRIGALRCRNDPRDPWADASFSRALALDSNSAAAWSGRAACAQARGDVEGARAAARRAAELDPRADHANVMALGSRASRDAASERIALLALTVTAREKPVAWGALAAWAHASGDVALWALALEQMAHVAPEKTAELVLAAEELSGLGRTEEARVVAAAVASTAAGDAHRFFAGHALAARLALDESVEGGDPEASSHRATQVRLPIDEAAGRALLEGHAAAARALATATARADPGAEGARLVLAVSGDGDPVGTGRSAGRSGAGEPPSAAAFVAFGCALVRVASPDDARTILASMTHAPIVSGDDVVVRPAVELAARGVLTADALPLDGVVELAALRGSAIDEEWLADATPRLDVRHQYLALALAHPDRERARELGDQLTKASPHDSIVATASALLRAASGAAPAVTAAQDLLSRDSGNPLLAATALRLAEKGGSVDVARRARAALVALGQPGRESVR